MKMLPEHGKIDCRLCYPADANEATPHRLWRMRNDPGAWGGREPEWLVLGFSKGSTQADYYANGSFDDVAFAGMRSRLERILKRLGALPSGVTLNDAIANPEGNIAFGSLIRCSVARQDSKAKYQCSGSLITKSFKEIPQVIAACTNQFLKHLPDSVKIVVMLGNNSSYVKPCHDLIREMFPEAFEELNEVAVRADGRLWVHVAHPSGANGYFERWMESGAGAARKRKLVEAALGVHTDLPHGKIFQQAKLDEKPPSNSFSQSISDVAKHQAEKVAESVSSVSGQITLRSRVRRGKQSGTLLVPHRYRDGCYVVSMTKFDQDQVRVQTMEQVVAYIQQGYKLRMSDPANPRSPSLISPKWIEIL
jgi:hypothetical protein